MRQNELIICDQDNGQKGLVRVDVHAWIYRDREN